MSEPTLTQIAVSVARVEEIVKATHDRLGEHLDMDEKVHEYHNQRIRKLEESRWRILGGAAVIAAIAGPLAAAGARYAIAAIGG